MHWYYVARSPDGTWAVLFENQPRAYTYRSKVEAIQAAVEAAEFSRKQHVEAGVQVKEIDDDDWRVAVSYGECH
ncbi:DUF2188 domain-containing protein [Lysobacter sp. P5_B9]